MSNQRKLDPILDIMDQVPGYDSLQFVLKQAYDQATIGKGKERHAGGRPFDEQPIMTIPRTLNGIAGLGGLAYQINKKTTEAVNMADRGYFEAAQREFLGAINYLAAAYLYTNHLSNQKEKVTGDSPE